MIVAKFLGCGLQERQQLNRLSGNAEHRLRCCCVFSEVHYYQ